MVKVRRRNFSSTSRRYSTAQGIVVSIPKSGRTWIRVFLTVYLCSLKQRAFTLDPNELGRNGIPEFMFTHDLWEHLTIARFKDWLRGKHLVPRRESAEKPLILLARDPRDVLVSLFFQLTKREHRYHGTLSEMIRHPKFGVNRIVEIMNHWIEDWGQQKNFKLVRYEECRSETKTCFREILQFLGCRHVDESILERSITFSSFENMKAMESSGQFGAGILTPGNPADVESFKVRRGLVGGYQQYFDQADLAYLERALRALHLRYGYTEDCSSTR